MPVPDGTDAVREALERELGDKVSWAEPALRENARDHGGLAEARPAVVVRAASEDDVVRAFRVARATGTRVTVRGTAHSASGQTLCAGGLVVVNAVDDAQCRLLDGDRVEVSGRTRWGALESALNSSGRSAPVLTTNGDVTVGGTLSVGGYGFRSVAFGAQVDQVERLRLILPDGTALWCSADENGELFRFSLSGFGQVGVIERAVMRTIPFADRRRLFSVHHVGPEALVDSLAWLEGPEGAAVDTFAAFHAVGRSTFSYHGLAPDWPEEALPEPLARLAPKPVAADSIPLRAHETHEGLNLPVDYVFDRAGLRAFLRFLELEWYGGVLPMCVDAFLVLAIRRPLQVVRPPFDAASFGSEPLLCLVGFYPAFGEDNVAGAKRVRPVLRRCLEKCLELGGRPYLYGIHDLEPQERSALYGTDLERLRGLRRELDPNGLLNAGAL